MKKLASILLASVMAFSLAACGSPAPANQESATQESTAQEPAAQEPAAQEPAAQETSGGGLISIGIVNNPPSESGYREANVKDFESVFSTANGYNAKTFYSITNDEQLNAAQQFITEGVGYLLISAAETTGWDAVLQSARENGVKVFLFDRMIDCDESLYESAVVSDMRNQGVTAVEWLKAQNLPEYNIIHIQGAMGSDAQLGRTGPLAEAVEANANWNFAAQQTATWDEAQAKQIVESVINAGTPFNVVYAENDGMATGAVAALDEAGITHGVNGDVIIMGFDCNKFALRNLLSGSWNYDGQCSPFQAAVIDGMIKNGVTQKKVISEEKGFDAKTITEADIAAYGLGEDPGAPAAAKPADSAPIPIGIVNNPPSESGYREANVKDFESVFSAANGYNARSFYSITNDEQLNAAQQFITDGVEYLLISAAETTGWDAVLQSARENGVKVFLFDRMIDCDESLYESAVVSDMRNQGVTAVEWLKAQNLPEYNIIHIQGAMGSDAQLGRTGPLAEAVEANADWSFAAQQTATWDEAQAKQIVESVINAGTPFNVVYAENDGMATGAVAALDEAGITHGVDGDVIIMGFDCNKFALRNLLSGSWNYDGQCSPFQASVIDGMIKNGVTQKKVISEEKGFDAKTITQADIDTYGLGD